MATDAFWLEKYFFETREYFLGEADSGNFDLKIMQLSDLHIREMGSTLRKVAESVNAHQPDLLLLSGDSIDDGKNLRLLGQFLASIDHSIPKFAIPGNWEYWGNADMEKLRAIYAAHNAELLINQSRQIRLKELSVSITGTDDFVAGNADIDQAISQFIPGDYHLLLNHCPAYSDTIAEVLRQRKIPYDLILSGHTHGGQITLAGWAPFKPNGSGKYLNGWYEDVKMYVSKGIGTSILPLRFMARAEITLFWLKK